MANKVKDESPTAPTFQIREELYKLVISQLYYDGFSQNAVELARILNVQAACPPSDKLTQLVAEGLAKLQSEKQPNNPLTAAAHLPPVDGIDLDFEAEKLPNSPKPAEYETVYVTSHKGPCRAGAFSKDGLLVATGSSDNSIKILDVEKMIAKSTGQPDNQQTQQNDSTHPVIRTLYDHVDEVTCLTFHPTEQILISGSVDCTVKVYDFSKPSVKRASKTIQEAAKLRCLSVHPTGDYLLVGTEQPTLRLYDLTTLQCFCSSNPGDQHVSPITAIEYNSNGSLYATCSKDGDIKIWDGVSNRVVNAYPRAHDGFEICSVKFTRNGKYLLSSAKDSQVKLWELSMSRCLIAYTGAGSLAKQVHRAQACFNHTEDYVLFPDEKTTSLCSWNSRNAERSELLSLGHNSPVRYFEHSPTGAAFLSCSDDFRARFWYKVPDTGGI